MPKLANNEMGGFTDAVRLTFADLKAIGNGGTKVIGTIPAGGAVEIVGALTTVPVVGTTSLSIGVGFSGTAAAFISAWDGDASAAPAYNTGSLFTTGFSAAVSRVATATPIILTLTDATIASITAGEIVIGLRILDLGRFKND